jgi:hypothetical protein
MRIEPSCPRLRGVLRARQELARRAIEHVVEAIAIRGDDKRSRTPANLGVN